MKRVYRLRGNSDFQRVRREGQSYASRFVVLAFLRNELECSRFGFVVNRRLGNAVHRNKIKRRLREATRLRLPIIKPGFDVVFIARQPIRQADYWTVDQTVVELLAKAGLLVADKSSSDD